MTLCCCQKRSHTEAYASFVERSKLQMLQHSNAIAANSSPTAGPWMRFPVCWCSPDIVSQSSASIVQSLMRGTENNHDFCNNILTTMWCAYDGQVKDMVRLSAPSLARGCHQCINDIGHKVACVRPLHPSVLGVSPASEQRPHPDRGAPMMWSPHAVSSLVVAIPSIAKPLPIPQKHADHWTSTASRTHPLVLSATIMSAADPQKHCSVHTNASVIP